MHSTHDAHGKQLDFAQTLHAMTPRDYVARVVEHDKAACAAVATQYGEDYWDGDRCYGYGGYRYDGRWRGLAAKLAQRFALTDGQRVLDVGCGKGYLLYELGQIVPGLKCHGLDISDYAATHAKPEVASSITIGDATALPFATGQFDVILSLGTLHNLGIADLWRALAEIERVTKDGRGYVMVESYRNEREKANLLYWQLTCRSFYSVDDWKWIYAQVGYRGDFDFIFFT